MVLLGDIDSKRNAAGQSPVGGSVRAILESLDESDILGAHAMAVHEAACAFTGFEADDERRSQSCADFLIRQLVPEALEAFDGEWLKSDAEACRALKGQALTDAMTALYDRVRDLAAVTRLRVDLERGYTNAKTAEERLARSVWGGVALALLAGSRGTAAEEVTVPAAEIVRLLVSARLYDLVDAEDLAASSEDAFVPWSAPPLPQLSSATGRFAPFEEQQQRLLQRLGAFVVDDLLR